MESAVFLMRFNNCEPIDIKLGTWTVLQKTRVGQFWVLLVSSSCGPKSSHFFGLCHNPLHPFGRCISAFSFMKIMCRKIVLFLTHDIIGWCSLCFISVHRYAYDVWRYAILSCMPETTTTTVTQELFAQLHVIIGLCVVIAVEQFYCNGIFCHATHEIATVVQILGLESLLEL